MNSSHFFKSCLNHILNKTIIHSCKTFGHNFKCILRSSSSYQVVESTHYEKIVRIIPQHIKKPEYATNGRVIRPSHVDLKNEQQLNAMKASCQMAKKILSTVGNELKEGMSCEHIDELVYRLCIENNVYPSPLNYKGFPKCVTTSINNIAVHGIPDKRILMNGDVITVDVSIYMDGFHGDCAHTFLIGDCDEDVKHLVKVAELCLIEAIKLCRDGQRLCLIGQIIERIARDNCLNVVPSFCGHGIGTYLHGPPQILHYHNNSPEVMLENMVFTIEPVLTEGNGDVFVFDDNWTVSTQDYGRTAQFEHTICIKKDNAVILTQLDSENQINS